MALLTHTVKAGSSTPGTLVTDPISTLGATLIALISTGLFGPLDITADTGSNTFVNGNTVTSGARNARISWVIAPATNAAHTFTLSGTDNRFQGVTVACFDDVSPVFDQQNTGATSAGTTIQPGSLTPASANNLFLVGLGGDANTSISIGAGTIADACLGVGSVNFGAALAYFDQTAATAQNPTWTVGANGSVLLAMSVVFSYSGGGPTAPTYPQLERGIRGLARGVGGGLARSFVRKDRIFVPAYATYDLKAAA